MNITNMLSDLETIREDLFLRLQEDSSDVNINDFAIETFVQVWSNTSCGLSLVGGQSLTERRVYVFIPRYAYYTQDKSNVMCYIYIGSCFAYSVPYSERLMSDIKDKNIRGVFYKSEYFDCD